MSLTLVFTLCPSCTSDETCNNTTNSCDCNPSKYSETEQNPLPEITCNYNMVLRIPRCQLEKNGYDSSSYALNNPNCKLTPYLDNISFLGILWHIGAGDCGNIKTENSTHITYSNSLIINPKPSIFITKNKVIYNFSCIYPQNMDTALYPLNVATG
ncbi:uromodulin-like [Xenopus laevis]|uniref:Uromodulin-like n=1 Tax=Xenopus laevis TaxID=8355 RepID=A0A8J1M7U5_XENLA|nr:uromodulin-like [Xenopus laevis]